MARSSAIVPEIFEIAEPSTKRQNTLDEHAQPYDLKGRGSVCQLGLMVCRFWICQAFGHLLFIDVDVVWVYWSSLSPWSLQRLWLQETATRTLKTGTYVMTSTKRSVPLSGAIWGGDGLFRINRKECRYCIHPAKQNGAIDLWKTARTPKLSFDCGITLCSDVAFPHTLYTHVLRI